MEEKQRFFNRVYTEWDVGGEQIEINSTWFPQFVTKTLINVQHNLNKMIDVGESKPTDVDSKVWDTLCTKRKSQKSKEKYEQMRMASLTKNTKEAQLRSIEKTMIGELTLRQKRILYEGEVRDAIEKEYARRQAEARKGIPDYAKDIEDMHATTSETGERLSRLEDMIRSLVHSLGWNTSQHHIVSNAPGGHKLLKDDVGNDMPIDEDGAFNVKEDTGATTVQTGDVVGNNAEDANVEVDYLLDNIVDVFADYNTKNLTDDVPSVVT